MSLKIIFSAVIAFQALCLTASSSYSFVSFNIWGDYFGNPPHERDVQQAEILKSHNPDFVALQEMTGTFWNSRLVGNLTNEFEEVGRKMGPGGIDAFSPLFFGFLSLFC